MAKKQSEEIFLDGAGGLTDETPAEPVGATTSSAVENKAKEILAKGRERIAESQTQSVREGLFFFDLETVPDEERKHLFGLEELPPIPDAMAEKDCPDPTQIAVSTEADMKKLLLADGTVWPEAWLAKLMEGERTGKNRSGVQDVIKKAGNVRGDIVRAHADRLKLLSVTPEYCRIASFAYACDDGEIECYVSPSSTLSVRDGTKIAKHVVTVSETQLLTIFWDLWAAMQKLVGYNIFFFDLPVIYVRSIILGVRHTKPIDMRKWSEDVVDLYKKRYPDAPPTGAPAKLKSQARMYGIPIPAGDTDGSSVLDMMNEGSYAEVAAYNMSDVDISRQLHHKMRGFFT